MAKHGRHYTIGNFTGATIQLGSVYTSHKQSIITWEGDEACV